jgi:tRNA (guanosine-2'-O-)-methyltransferase
MGKRTGYKRERTEKREQRIASVLEKKQPDLTVILENINDPHNLSAVLRSCDAVGVLEVHMVYHSGQPFPKLGRKSSGSAKKWIDTRRYESIDECFACVHSEGKKIYTTHMAADSVSLYDLKLDEPVALVFGNEHEGVSDGAVELADANFLIPQVGMIQSLNISVAAAVSLYEVFRQRMESGKYARPQLSPAEFAALNEDWLKR